MTIRRFSIPMLLAVLIGFNSGLAGTTGKISGKVTDAITGEALIGVNITIEGTSLGAASNIEGDYVILSVPPGKYTVLASYIGYLRKKIENVRVSVDFTTTLNISMQPGDIQLDAVVVQGERTPLIRKDLTNPVSSISSESLSELPITEISEVIGLQAGVTVGDDGVLHIRGGYGNEIVYTLNGVNINNPYGNTRSVRLATNAVQEVSVSSGTFSAEYGGGLSGVVNYVTKEGGRKFNGGIRYFTGDHLSTRKDLFPNIGKATPNNVYRIESTLGGPIIGDQLTFYVSGVYDYYGGHFYGTRLYLPEDSYLSKEGFPSSDPRRGTASSAYYFGPLSHPTSDLVGGPSGDGALVPLNWSRSYNIQANISFKLTSEMRLKYEAVYDNDLRPESGGNSAIWDSWYKPDGRRVSKGYGLVQSLEFSNVINERMFYTVKAWLGRDVGDSRAYESIDDPRYLPSFYLQRIPNTNFLTGGTDLARFHRQTQTIGGKVDLVAQLFNVHEVMAGVEFRHHTLDVESYTLQFNDPNDPNIEPTFNNALTKGSKFRAYIPSEVAGYVNYSHRPFEISAYVRDKIELFKSIILNVGVRFERFQPSAQFNSQLSSELLLQDTVFLKKNLTDATVKNMVSPRVSVSYPITDKGTIRFSYGHFYQIGSLSSLYTNPNFRAPLGTSPTFGNPDVNPQRSVQYEMGLQQGFTENLKIDVNAYYKDVRDYIFFQNIITERGDRNYSVLTNLSYANTRGVSISLVKRRGMSDPLSATIDYTYQIAEGNRTQPTDELFFNEQQGKLSETYLVALGFDRSHTLTSSVSLSEPSNWIVSLIGYVRTGTPYTPSFPSSVIPITFVQNSDRQPLQWNVDLKMEKYLNLAGFDCSVYLQVDNVFDVQNELSVYANSGRALSNILTTLDPAQFLDLRNRIIRGDKGMIPLDAVDNYYRTPLNLNMPRLVRVGFSLIY